MECVNFSTDQHSIADHRQDNEGRSRALSPLSTGQGEMSVTHTSMAITVSVVMGELLAGATTYLANM